MKNVSIGILITLASILAQAMPVMSKIKLTCSPTSQSVFDRETVEVLVDRTNLQKVTASFNQMADKYSDYIDPIVTIGTLSGTEYFEILTLQGIIKNEFRTTQIKLKIQNGVLRFLDPNEMFIDTNPYDERDWNCSEQL